jgi:hypothetical protein
MEPFCGFSALCLRNRFSRFSASIASLLILLFVVPPGAYAKAKPLTAATVHARILKRGIGNPVGVEESNGVELIGRIIAVNPDSFTLQLFNDPDPVTVNNADVVDLKTGPSRGFWIVTAVGIGAVVGGAIWGAVAMHNFQQEHQLPNMPAQQPLP